MYGGTNGEDEPFYGIAPMESEPAEIETRPQLLPPSRRLSPVQGLKAPRLASATIASTTTTLHAKTLYRMLEDYTTVLDFDANDPAELHSYGSLARGFFAWGSNTAGITVFLFRCTCACARTGAYTRACTGDTARNHHGQQPLRHAARCYARCNTKPSSFACSYRLSGKSKQPLSCSRSIPDGRFNRCTS